MLVAMTIRCVERMAIVAGREPLEGRMLLLDHLRGPEGRPRIGPLAALADSVAGVHAFEVTSGAVPLTSDLATHLVGGPVPAGTELRATSEILKRRRSGAVFAVAIYERDDPQHLVATATVTYTLVEGLPAYAPEPHPGTWPPEVLSVSMDDLLPLSLDGGDGLDLEIDDLTRNAVGVLSGGAVVVAADLAAERWAGTATGSSAEVTDLHVHFLAPGRSGPARFSLDGTVQGSIGLARTTVTETGPDAISPGPIASSTARFRLVERPHR